MTDFLATLTALGLATYYLVEIVRKLPIIERLVLRGTRPFACHQCMVLWTSLVLHLALWWWALLPLSGGFWVISWAGTGGVALTLLFWTEKPPGAFTLPD